MWQTRITEWAERNATGEDATVWRGNDSGPVLATPAALALGVVAVVGATVARTVIDVAASVTEKVAVQGGQPFQFAGTALSGKRSTAQNGSIEELLAQAIA